MLGLKVAGGRMTGKYILAGKRKQARKTGVKKRSRKDGRIQRNKRRKEWVRYTKEQGCGLWES